MLEELAGLACTPGFKMLRRKWARRRKFNHQATIQECVFVLGMGDIEYAN